MPIVVEEQLSRAAVYRVLAQLWARELHSSAMLLSDPEFGRLWTSLGGCGPEVLKDNPDSVAEDFCRIFIGPKGHLPPIQSVWQAGELQSEVVSSFLEYADIANYDSPWPELLPDHIANELQLMSVILSKAASESERSRCEAALDLAKNYFAGHLSWPEMFLPKVFAADSDGFYGSLATVTQSFLTQEHSEYSVNA